MSNDDAQDKPPSILVVDDQKTMRLLLRRAMEREGYQVIEAMDGQQCLNLCLQTALLPHAKVLPDIILLDAMMPIVDGFTCCAQLTQKLGRLCPPILIVTTLNDEESVNQAFESGAADYITKPVHWPVLRQRVRRLLQSNWAMAELQRKIEQERLLKEQLELVNRKLQQLASLDGLTQIANRRCFDERFEQEWQRSSRDQLPLSLLLVDIDFFKTYNDTYGHQAGDECLKKVAQIIQQSVKRPADLVARYGGEEFVVILPNTSSHGALQVAETIRAALRQQAIAHGGSKTSAFLTLSIGIATLVPSSIITSDRLLADADQALYQAKQRGRDRIVWNTMLS